MDIDRLFDIRGKTALVTGASGGIGYMIAGGLVRAGAKVWICSRKSAGILAAAERLRQFGAVEAIVGDLSSETGIAAVAGVINASGPLHILVNNAGTTWGAPIAQFPRAGFEKVLNLNLLAPFEMIRMLLPALRSAGTPTDPARVINITSVDGSRVPSWESYPYAATKAGLNHMTRHLGKYLAGDHISVNALAPGLFRTKMSGSVVDFEDADALKDFVSPLGQRVGTPEDIVGGVIYLSSRAGAWLSGLTIPISGGIGTID
jgi:NAD(P)-dependent dehydrogenase (short-subunit alcohol dehydrogenase family)